MLQKDSNPPHLTKESADASGDMSDAGAILNQFIDAIGGRAAIERINTKITETTTYLPAKKQEIKSTTFIKKPDKAYLVVVFKLFGATIRSEGGRNGDVGWQMTPGAFRPTYKLLSGKEKELKFADLAFDTLAVNWEQYFKFIHLAGEENVDGRPCYSVVFKPHDTSYKDTVCFFEKETSLVKKIIKETYFRDQPGIAEIYVSDYKQAGEVMFPHTLKCFTKGEDDVVISIDRIQCNADIPDSKFELPEKIKALAKNKTTP